MYVCFFVYIVRHLTLAISVINECLNIQSRLISSVFNIFCNAQKPPIRVKSGSCNMHYIGISISMLYAMSGCFHDSYHMSWDIGSMFILEMHTLLLRFILWELKVIGVYSKSMWRFTSIENVCFVHTPLQTQHISINLISMANALELL